MRLLKTSVKFPFMVGALALCAVVCAVSCAPALWRECWESTEPRR